MGSSLSMKSQGFNYKMNNQIIEKIITSNNLQCPIFTYENPVLDKNVAKALSKSFVKILNLSQQNCKVNNNLRLSILENIRKMCQVEPENHLKIDEKFTSLITEYYEEIIKDSAAIVTDSTNKNLDAFLIRNLKEMNLNSSQNSQLNPEVIQALINLNQNGAIFETLLKDIIHWNCSENKYIQILKDLWTNNDLNTASHTTEDTSIKLKSEIEKAILQICHSILSEENPYIQEMIKTDLSLKNVINRSSVSANCFQICSGILNYLFIMTNFDERIQIFIKVFVKHIKEKCALNSFSVLYPTHLSHIIVLLDIDLAELPSHLQNSYIECTKKYLSELMTTSRNDLILLLSHFPQWFNIFFDT